MGWWIVIVPILGVLLFSVLWAVLCLWLVSIYFDLWKGLILSQIASHFLRRRTGFISKD
jgi:hypothetical protein